MFRQSIRAESDIHMAIHRATSEARTLAFDAIHMAKLKTVISELGYNVIKYAGQGNVVIFRVEEPQSGLKVVVSDNGPGIADLDKALSDHFSSSGTLGLGLPGVRRMVDEFDILSKEGEGTTVTIILYK